jgi:glucan phosphoethanolaminetransferase (alkaline phosphatase superfamily)
MNIIKSIKEWWKKNPHFVAFLFAIPIGMFVVIATFFQKNSGNETYAKNYVLEQAVILLSMGLFLLLTGFMKVSRKLAIISMVLVFIALQVAMTHFKILSG